MIGNWKWNAALGLIGMIITLLANVGSNLLLTSVLRSLYVFVLLFLFGYAFRFVLGRLIRSGKGEADEQPGTNDEPWKGSNIDMTTPEDGFTPLVPPRVPGGETAEQPETIARVIRHMSEQ